MFKPKQVGGDPPKSGALQGWINVVQNTSTEALAALREITEKGVQEADESYKRISKTWLEQKAVAELKTKPEQQALALQIFAR